MDKQDIINEIKKFKIYSCDDLFIINNKEIIFIVVDSNKEYHEKYSDVLLKKDEAKKQYLNTFDSLFIMIIDNMLFLLGKIDYYSKLETCILLS